MKEFFKVLFEPGEGYCTGNAKSVNVTLNPREADFFCINPLHVNKDYGHFKKDYYNEFKPRRADINISCLRNFMFEMDGLPVDDQIKIFNNSDIPFTSLVFSGSKSCHAILSVENSVQLFEPHTQEGINTYKSAWRSLAGKLDFEAKSLGYEKGVDVKSFIDFSCQNPSRLSRYPEVIRASNGKNQELLMLGDRMSIEDFVILLESCPIVKSIEHSEDFTPPEDELHSSEDFEAWASKGLLRDLKYAPWAGQENMYQELYKKSMWAIDSTNVSYHAFIEFLNKYTFKILLSKGYPAWKLTIGVEHAFREKGRL